MQIRNNPALAGHNFKANKEYFKSPKGVNV